MTSLSALARGFFALAGALLLVSAAACSDDAASEDRCPEYSPPLCGPGERIVVEKDADGCGVPKCGPACPQFSPPSCGAGERIVSEKNAEGCDVPKCAPAA